MFYLRCRQSDIALALVVHFELRISSLIFEKEKIEMALLELLVARGPTSYEKIAVKSFVTLFF